MERIIRLETDSQPIELEGEVIAADLETSTGKLLVFENKHLQEDIYSFEVLETIQNRYLFKEVFLNEVRVNCQLVTDSDERYLRITELELR